MRKIMALALSLALALSAAGALAETPETVFDTMAGLSWSFSSGVGAWSTDLRFAPDGTFSGEYHDSEMGETGDGYPDGTVYGCTFTGRLSLIGPAGDHVWKLRVDTLTPDEGQVPEAVEDGIRYVTAQPYGLTEGDEMLLYAPGTPVSVFSEDMLFWTHVTDLEDSPAELNSWFLCSEKNGSGFVGEAPAPAAYMPNPWEDLTEDQLAQASGLRFAVPEDAENVIYRYLRSEGLAEMQFTMGPDEFCARIVPAALGEGELMDISGMYFAWEHEEPITVGSCSGTIALAQADGHDWVERCLWYDAAPGLMYCLSVCTPDPDGLDLTAVAEQVYLPLQGNN